MPGQSLGIIALGDLPHGWQPDEPFTQALHPPAFLVDRYEQVRAQSAYRCTQLPHLTRVGNITCKDDQTSYFRLDQQLTILGRQRGAFDIDHQGPLHTKCHDKIL
jgi:hypothetical protein